ncbi:ATP-binding cassette domain-containing protein [Clostridium botulinum]|nr:ATP-binding cassette domain-containing protein [Clostridium botulinum]
MDEVSDVQEKVNAKKLPRVKGEVEFKGISFSYNDEIKVLKNINLKVNPGETVAFVGATGVGKTTIASLLNRFYDPQSGSILMDGIDIKDVTLKSLRDNISMVLQDTFLFNGTIYENIVYGWKEATRNQVLAASKAANAHNFIENLEDGYDTIIGERGVRLSGGQNREFL